MNTSYFYIAVSVIAFLVVFVSFLKPIKSVFKIIINSFVGAGAIIVSNFLLKGVGICLGVNVLNAFIVGILGFPGLGALILINKFL